MGVAPTLGTYKKHNWFPTPTPALPTRGRGKQKLETVVTSLLLVVVFDFFKLGIHDVVEFVALHRAFILVVVIITR